MSACGESLKEAATRNQQATGNGQQANNETEAAELQLILLYNFYSFILSAAA